MKDFVDAVNFVAHHLVSGSPSLAELTLKHLELTGAAVGIAILIAIPLGLWLGHIRRGSFVAVNGSNVLRALPTLALIAMLIPVFGIGFFANMVALVVIAIAPILLNTYVGVAGVERDAVEAAQGMGMRPGQILREVEIPLALPLIFAGLRTSIVFVIATATIASAAGGSSLGDIIFNQASYGLPGVLGAAFMVALLALIVEVGGALLQRAVTPRGMKAKGPGTQAKTDVLTAAPATT